MPPRIIASFGPKTYTIFSNFNGYHEQYDRSVRVRTPYPYFFTFDYARILFDYVLEALAPPPTDYPAERWPTHPFSRDPQCYSCIFHATSLALHVHPSYTSWHSII